MNTKKRHHHLPICYMKNFCDVQGNVFATKKSNPGSPLYLAPENIGFQKYYYSQPLPEGGYDNNSLEDIFSGLEFQWDLFMRSLISSNYAYKQHVKNIYAFMCLQFARGPAYRDAYELTWAESIKRNYKEMWEKGQLPLIPIDTKKYFRNPTISIDPHRSMSAIPKVMERIGYLLGYSGFKLFHNSTGVNFLTSDNPVIFFNPNVSEERIIPYKVNIRNELEFIFPISPKHLIHGHPSYSSQDSIGNIKVRVLDDLSAIERFNRLICRFGYRFIIATDEQHKELIIKFSNKSPVPLYRDLPTDIDSFYMPKFRFGKVQSKIKWKK